MTACCRSRPIQRLWPAGRSQGADRRRARARPDGVSRRRLQSLRPGRKLSSPHRAAFFSDAHHTPWGSAIDYRVPDVRALRSRTRCTGCAITASTGCGSTPCTPSLEPGEPHILSDLAAAVGAFAAESGRHIHLVLENDDNAARFLPPRRPAGLLSRAMERRLPSRLARAADGRARRLLQRLSGRRRAHRPHAGEGLRLSRRAVAASAAASRAASRARICRAPTFVNFLQNHDQIGNRAAGRAAGHAGRDPTAWKPRSPCCCCSPAPPLMFMGDEWGAREPSRSSATSKANWRRPCARAAGANSPRPMPSTATKFPTRSLPRRASPAVLDWDAREEPAHGTRLALDTCAARAAPRHIVAASAGDDAPGAVTSIAACCMRAGAPTRAETACCSPICPAQRRPNPVRFWGAPIWGDAPPRDLPPWPSMRDWRGLMTPAVPLATYRLQLTKDFGFDDAAALVPYLKELGIRHLYASPFLKARPGSTHGYDIVDHDRLNPELGGEEALCAHCPQRSEQHDLGLILDFVPNHMGVGHADNAWWLDVLEWGPSSPYAAFFDIDWEGCRIAAIPACCSRSSAGPMARRCRPAISRFAMTRTPAALPPGISSTSCRSIRSVTLKSCARPWRRPMPRTRRPAARCWRWPTNIAARRRQPIASAPELKRRLAAIAGRGAAHGARAHGLSQRQRAGDGGPASLARTPALSACLLARRLLGGQLPAVFRHQRSRRPAGRKPGDLPRHPYAGRPADRGRRLAGPAPRPYRRTARSRAIHPAAAPAGRQGA